jgi:gluconate 2-dehydrogenase gamma chain
VNEELSALGSRLSADDETVSRRDALKSFALVGLASALEITPAHLERVLAGVAESREPQAQSQQFVPKFFTQHEWRTLRMLVDYIIPKDEHSGSATDAKVPEFMDFLLADKDANEAQRIAIRGGLGWLDEESRSRFGKNFTAAADADRRKILDDIAWPQKAPDGVSHGVAFFSRMRDFTASGFYSSQVGWKDLKYMGNVSLPRWDGCPQPALDKLSVSYDLMNSRVAPQE